jgi:PBP1b-binding outer membrane lipoprotein LpoB
MKITKLALIGLLFASALFITGCEKSPADDTEEVTEAAE